MEKSFTEYLQKHNYRSFDIKAVLFDMDGVLYDSMKHHAKSWHEVMSEEGITSTPEEFYMHEGRVGYDTIDLLINREFNREATQEEKERIYKRKSELFSHYNEGETIPFALDMLKAVKASGMECIVVTGSGQPTLLDKLDKNFPNIFAKEKMVTAFDVNKGKPDPEPYLMGLKRGGNLKPNQAIVIENAPMGIEAAVTAGIFTIAINTGPLENQVLWDSGANIVFPSMETLYNDWEKIKKELTK